RRGRRALAEDLDRALALDRDAQPDLGRFVATGRQLDPLDLLPAGPEPARYRWVARQVEAFAYGHHRRPRNLVDLPAATGRLAPRHGTVVADLDPLDPRHARPVERDGDPDADLVVAAVGR